MKFVATILLWFRFVFPDIMFLLSKNKDDIIADYYKIQNRKFNIFFLNISLLMNKEYRSVFYYRTRKYKLLSIIAKTFLSPIDGIEIYGEIGAGLRVLHRSGATIHPLKAGKNLTVGQGATIGVKNGKNPIIGDNVHISTNAVVIGGITLGNDVVVGAGSVVIKDVPNGCTVAGVPAKIIKNIMLHTENADE